MILLPLAISLGTALLLDRNVEEKKPTLDDLEESLHASTGEKFGSAVPPEQPPETSPAKTLSPAETFLRMNAEEIPDYLLLAVIISGATGSRDPVDVGLDLIAKTSGNIGLLTSAQTLEQVGIGSTGKARILASGELARRVALRTASLSQRTILTAREAADVIRTVTTGPYEKLAMLLLDRRRKVLALRLITIGSDGFTVVDPRQIFRIALDIGAHAVILAHQHPSGDPSPSSQDRDVTKRVAAAGRAIGIALLDHLVIAGDRYVSLAEQGELPYWSGEDALHTGEP